MAKEKEVFMAKYDSTTLRNQIVPLMIIRETTDFVVVIDDIKGQARYKKVTDDWVIFDFFLDAKAYLKGRLVDDIDYFLDMMGKGEVEIEKLNRMANANDKVNIEYTKIEIVEEIKDEEFVPIQINYDPDHYSSVAFHF